MRILGPLVVVVLVLGLTTPLSADTRIGVAKAINLQSWSFINFGAGETKITVSWTKSAINVIVILVCGTSDPQVFGIAAAGLNRYAEIVAGVPPNQTCLVGVSTVQGNTAYRVHFNQTVSEISKGEGRIPLEVSDTTALEWAAQQEVDRLRLKLEQ